MRKIALLLVCIAICSMQVVFAQSRTITGRVSDADDGSTLPGVSVVVKGTSIGTVTDIEGKFSLNIPQDAQALVLSFVGMEPLEAAVTAVSNYELKMQKTTLSVDEVVVTAMGIRKEAKALGYAVQEINSDELNRVGTPNLSQALQGKIAGVDIKVSSGMPGASSQFVIRGARSFTGNNTPLYVIDGMPVESTAPFSTGNSVTGSDVANRAIDINPNDIESINVLKGQAAAALYGMKASNGVVIITTKSGKGGAEGKTLVSISQNTSFDRVSRTPDYQQTYAQGTGGSYSPRSSMSWGPMISELPNDPNYGGNTENDYTAEFGMQEGKYYVPQLADAGLDPWATPGVYNNWNDYFQTGVNSNTSINVSKASKEGSYSVGIGYTDQTGIALNTGMKRWNAKATAERKLNDNFRSGFSANYTNLGIDKLTGANDGSLAGVLSAPASYNLKGTPANKPGDPYSQIYYPSLTFDNPYWVKENNTFTEATDRFFGSAFVDYTAKLTESMNLVLKYQLGADAYTSHYQDIFGFGSKGGAGTINNYGATQTTVNSLVTAVYDWSISDDFSFNLLAGNEFNHQNLKTYDQSGEKFNFGGWNHITNVATVTANESKYQERTIGLFYSASIDYKSMLFLSTTGRNDIASTMPRGNRSFFYPSVSLSFVATELEGLKDLSWLNFAKVRGSYAEVGQAGNYYENYYTTPSYEGSWWTGNPVAYPINGVSSYIPNSVQYDPNLRPQNTRSYEIGLNMKFFDNRVGIDYTYSNQMSEGQIFTVPLAGSTGANSLVMNAGSMKTDAHELVLLLVPIKTKDFTWDFNVNYTQSVNECTELAEGVESIFLGGFVTPQVRAGVGYTFPVIYGGMYARDEEGRILVNEDPNDAGYGMPMAGGDGIIGSAAPDFILGGSTNLTYKNISLGAVLEWKQGGEMYSGSNGLMDLYGVASRSNDRESTFVYQGYKADGTPNDIVRGGENDKGAYQTLYSDVIGNIDEAYIYGNSFVKLRELSLRFALPKKLIPGLDLSISAFARNILLWTELPNIDPESSQGNTNMMGSFERFSLPQTSSYGFGIDVKF